MSFHFAYVIQGYREVTERWNQEVRGPGGRGREEKEGERRIVRRRRRRRRRKGRRKERNMGRVEA